MLIPGNLFRAALAILVLAMSSAGFCATAVAQQQRSQTIYIPDPTPRPPDLQQIYAQDPLQKAKEQHDALIRNALRRQQIVTNTDKMALLAQEMHDDLISTNPDGRNSERAAEIERLAKKIRSLEKEH
jgi:hypothetical protein